MSLVGDISQISMCKLCRRGWQPYLHSPGREPQIVPPYRTQRTMGYFNYGLGVEASMPAIVLHGEVGAGNLTNTVV